MKNRIGIVGGGQLARMMIPPAQQLGFTVTVLDPTPNSPAGQIADRQIIAGLDDPKGMEELATHSDFLTLEWELANPELLEKIAKKNISVNPSAQTLQIIKDKYQQKVFLKKAGIPVAPFMEITRDPIASLQDDPSTSSGLRDVPVDTSLRIQKAAKKFGYPLLLKAKVGAYDGRGNFLIKNHTDIQKGLQKLEGKELYVEKFIPFEKELAIMVARSINGKIVTFPVVETIHKNNILQMTIAPAQIDATLITKAETLARKTMKHLKGAGVFGIEMFLTHSASSGQAKILVNEIAPRVHNSGHVTIEACTTSQFTQHIRAITGLPLGKTNMLTPAAVMINILGQREGKAEIKGLEKAEKIPGVTVHIYGKTQTKPERKMGHITVVGTTVAACLARARKAKRLLSI